MKDSDLRTPLLIVDLDNTLIRTDLLWEGLLTAIRENFLIIFLLPIWLLNGRVKLKQKVSAQVHIKPELLPYRKSVLQLIKERQLNNTEVWLVSASPQAWVKSVATHLGIFAQAIGTDSINLKGKNKLKEISTRIGQRKFSYMGDSFSDLHVWQKADEIIAVNPTSNLQKRILQLNKTTCVLNDKVNFITALARACRPHHWIKNVLVFIPLIAGHYFININHWKNALLAMVAFSVTASTVYIVNDLLDLDSDRKHSKKRLRPFASGDLSVTTGFLLIPILLLLSITISLNLSPKFFIIVFVYFVINIAYSLKLKEKAILDIIGLALMYTLRVLGGGVASSIHVSQWLLTFSIFLFYGLASVKRYQELKGEVVNSRRGYLPEDSIVILITGISISLMSILVLALYFNSESVLTLYGHPYRLWFLIPIMLYSLSRLWMHAHRGKVSSDPVLYILKDKGSWLLVSLFMLTLMLSL